MTLADRDDRLLDWVKRRAWGETTPEIAEIWGVSEGFVRRETNAVKRADIEHVGPHAARSYW